MKLRFEWDSRKATANRRKHRVGFDEATTVFDDALARIFDDVEHSTDEVREIIIGNSILERLLVVSFTEVAVEDIRIIAARLATRKEREDYEENVSA
ncbi:MAG TPA: BrnT family toxin [Blastocatellia bacterium]|nr:BrnT family toxin [Blastocatellia bacterium]